MEVYAAATGSFFLGAVLGLAAALVSFMQRSVCVLWSSEKGRQDMSKEASVYLFPRVVGEDSSH